MNAFIGNRPMPAYDDTSAQQIKPSGASEYDSIEPKAARQENSTNDLLLILWVDPALVPISSR